MTEVTKNWIAGFWHRIAALVIDCLALGVIGFLLGLVFEGVFVQLGGVGRLIGFAVGLAYLGVLNSRVGGGQTLGKRVMAIRVSDSSGNAISIGKSLARYSVFATPFLLNRAQLPAEVFNSFLIYPIALAIFGGLFSIIYLYIFNRLTRQSLHDLVVGSFVVNVEAPVERPGSIWKGHLFVVGALVLAALAGTVYLKGLAGTAPFDKLQAAHAALNAHPDVSSAEVALSTSHVRPMGEEGRKVDFARVQVGLSVNRIDDESLARELALIALEAYPDIRSRQSLRVSLVYGYDIGIWGKHYRHFYDFDPVVLEGGLNIE
ncbi:MAG: RDD family protein [Thalassolituus sp.]